MKRILLPILTIAGIFLLPVFINLIPAPADISLAPRVPIKQGTSSNWAGYAVETNLTNPQNGAVSDVKGSWTVPGVTASSGSSYSSIWVGIDGYSNNSVEQIGTEQDWVNGVARYYVWYEMYPKPSYMINKPISAGDVINAEVKFLGKGQFNLVLNNLTKGWSFTTSQKANKGDCQSAEWIVEAPWSGGVLPLANFGTVNLTGSTSTLNGVNGAINSALWQNDRINMASTAGTVKATTSALSTDGKSFSVTWNHN
jgi:hypothetical protein